MEATSKSMVPNIVKTLQRLMDMDSLMDIQHPFQLHSIEAGRFKTIRLSLYFIQFFFDFQT